MRMFRYHLEEERERDGEEEKKEKYSCMQTLQDQTRELFKEFKDDLFTPRSEKHC